MALPFDWRASCSNPPFSFGVPFPWDELDIDRMDFSRGDPPSLGLMAPRTDGREATLLFWFDPDGPNVATADVRPLVRDVEASRNVRLVRKRSVSLAGGSGRILIFEGVDSVVSHLIVNYGNGLLAGQLVLPASSSAGYLAHFETMLATWDWDRP